MLTREQMLADIQYLALRAKRTGGLDMDAKRDWGISSNSLVSVAYGVGTLQMPLDWSDYAACVRAVRKLPRHRRTRIVMDALAAQKHAVEKYNSAAARRSYYRKAA